MCQGSSFIANGKAEIHNTLSDTVMKHADARRDEADRLLKSVDELAGMTKEAAESAEDNKAKVRSTETHMHLYVH